MQNKRKIKKSNLKKIALSLGAISLVSTPILSTIACDGKTSKILVDTNSYEMPDKLIFIGANGSGSIKNIDTIFNKAPDHTQIVFKVDNIGNFSTTPPTTLSINETVHVKLLADSGYSVSNDKSKDYVVSSFYKILDSSNYEQFSTFDSVSRTLTIKNNVNEIASNVFTSGNYGDTGEKIGKLVFEENSIISKIDDNAFLKFQPYGQELKIPSNLIYIGANAFKEVPNLTNIEFEVGSN